MLTMEKADTCQRPWASCGTGRREQVISESLHKQQSFFNTLTLQPSLLTLVSIPQDCEMKILRGSKPLSLRSFFFSIKLSFVKYILSSMRMLPISLCNYKYDRWHQWFLNIEQPLQYYTNLVLSSYKDLFNSGFNVLCENFNRIDCPE